MCKLYIHKHPHTHGVGPRLSRAMLLGSQHISTMRVQAPTSLLARLTQRWSPPGWTLGLRVVWGAGLASETDT